jgi:hypothetical protein
MSPFTKGPVWARPLWRIIHTIGMNFDPEKNCDAVKEFFQTLSMYIPCPFCKAHYINFCRANPINNIVHSNSTREEVFNWTVLLHNDVNRKLFKAFVDEKKAWNLYENNILSYTMLKQMISILRMAFPSVSNSTSINKFIKVTHAFQCQTNDEKESGVIQNENQTSTLLREFAKFH